MCFKLNTRKLSNLAFPVKPEGYRHTHITLIPEILKKIHIPFETQE